MLLVIDGLVRLAVVPGDGDGGGRAAGHDGRLDVDRCRVHPHAGSEFVATDSVGGNGPTCLACRHAHGVTPCPMTAM
jgi:hypothetical protein